jgi:23S rRNA (uracil1939-C5)-methyltransferase
MDRSGASTAAAGEERLLVPGGIPGEDVRVRRLRPVGRSVLCELTAVVKASPNRVRPRCRHALVCGGCTWQHIAYPEQLRRKSAALGALLRRAMGERAPRVLPAIGMPVGADGMPWGFRQKAAFVFAEASEGLVMGHFARGTHDVVPVVECPVHAERANRTAFALRDALRAAGVPVASREGGLLRHVVVRSSKDESETVAMLVVARDDRRLERPLRAVLEGAERPEGLVVNVNDREGPYLVGRQTRRIAGTGHVREASLGPSFLVSPGSFFQTNVQAAATLVRLVLEALPGASGLRVLDLYSGGGLFALPIAQRGHRVTAVEESRKANRDAELNRRQNGVAAGVLELVASSVERALPRLAGKGFDAVILDPPREGAPESVIRGVFERLRPARGILVSCNPEALARELPLAVAAGYRVLRVQPVDMFPHTPHVEAVAVLERRGTGERHEPGPEGPRSGPGPGAGRRPGRTRGPSSLRDRREANGETRSASRRASDQAT